MDYEHRKTLQLTALALVVVTSATAAQDYDTTRSVPANSMIEFPLEGPAVVTPDVDLNSDGLINAADAPIYHKVTDWKPDAGQLVALFYSNGHKQIVLSVAVNGDTVPDIRRHLLLVRDPPPPDPDPGPIPDPQPIPDPEPEPAPATRFDIGPPVGDAFGNVPEPHRSTCLNAYKTAAIKAANVAATVPQIDAQLSAAISGTSNQQAIDAYNDVYLPRFIELRAAGELVSMRQDYAPMWLEIVEWWDR